ncbi:MAG: AAA family ATPase [Thermoleophilia bacterium]|nr:AAA family ATPase [Thermoleophilia bacterium]
MRPTSLAVRGLKSWREHELELAPLTAISGPNGAGKSALLEAVRLAILGHEPSVGKQLADTRKLVNEEVGWAEVGLSFDTGFGIRRRFGTSSETQVMPSRGESTGRACQARIDEETGGLVVSLNIGDFLERSDEQRRAWFFEHLPREAAVLDWATFATWTDGEEGPLADVVRNLWTYSVQAAPNAVIGLGSAIEVAHRQFLEGDTRRQAQGKVVARGDDLRRSSTPPAVVPEDALQDAEQRVGGLNQRIGEARAGREAIEAIRARVKRAEDELGRAERQREHTEGVRRDLERQFEELGPPVELDGLGLVLDGRAVLAAVLAELGRLETERTQAQERLAAARAHLHELRGREQALLQHGACPFAGLGCTTDTETLLAGARAELASSIDEARDRFEGAAGIEADVVEQIRIRTRERGRLEASAAAELERSRRRAALASDLAAKDVALRELAERAELHRKDLERARLEESALGGDDVLAGLYQVRGDAEAALRELQGDRERRVRYEAEQEAHAREVRELEALTAKASALKELDGNLRRLRAHVIQRMIEPLHEAADGILRSIDPHKRWRFVFEREGDRPTMDFGFEEDGALRLYDAASKGERVLLAVAFVGALLTVLAPPMRLLVIDDAEQLDPVRRRRLMETLVELRHLWDGVILAGACPLAGVEGWGVVQLGPVEDVAA